MKIKHCLIVFILLFNVTPLFAQLSVGVSAGLTHNELNTSSGYFYSREYTAQQGFSVAVLAQYAITDWFALQGELGYMKKNYSTQRLTPMLENEFENVDNGYFQLPIMGNFSFGGEKLRGFVNLGVYLGAWTDSHIEGQVLQSNSEMHSYSEAFAYNKTRDNRFDAGLLAGLGIEYLGSHRVKYFAEARILYGLTDMQKNYMKGVFPRTNTTFLFQLGAVYCF